MNRRNFLKAFSGAAVGVGVVICAPKIAALEVAPTYRFATLDEIFPYYMPELLKQLRETPFLDAMRAASNTATGARLMGVSYRFYGYTDKPYRAV